MGFAEGVVWSLLGAVVHTIIDVMRKFGAQRLPPADLIALLTIYNAAFAVLGVVLVDGGLPPLSALPDAALFTTAVVVTAVTGLVAAVLYQRAVSLAPLSLTVPYLAFAPVFVVFICPLFLGVAEAPSSMGLVGVTVVSLAGYRLGVLGAADTAAAAAAAAAAPTSSKDLGAAAVVSRATSNDGGSVSLLADSSSSKGGDAIVATLQLQQQQHLSLAVRSTAGAAGGGRANTPQQQQGEGPSQQQGSLHLRPGVQQAAAAGGGPADGGLPSSTSWHEPSPAAAHHSEAQPLLQQQQQSGQQQQQHHQQLPQHSWRLNAGGGGGRGRQKSPWAEAYYYKQQYPAAQDLWDAARGSLHSAAAQLLASATTAAGGGSPRHRSLAGVQQPHAGGGRALPLGIISSNSHSGGGGHCSTVLVATDSSSSSGSNGGSSTWADSQAKGGKDHRLLPAGGWSARLPLVARVRALLSGPSAGPAMVLAVAFLYSITASLDKLGMAASSSTAFYIMAQRLLIAAFGLIYLLAASPGTLRHLGSDAVLLLTLSLAEQAAIVLYFKAIQNILVSYMVAIKRINILLSTLLGCLLFNERVGRRIPAICCMLVGMLLIVLQPGHEALHQHHSHTTRLHR